MLKQNNHGYCYLTRVSCVAILPLSVITLVQRCSNVTPASLFAKIKAQVIYGFLCTHSSPA